MAWKLEGNGAVFVQLADILRRDIVRGVYPPDSQFPTVRQLASDAAVNPNTMQKALTLLEEEGLLYARATVGRFVTSDSSILLAAKEKLVREKVRELLSHADALGVSKETLFEYIEQEKDKEENV